MMPQHLCQFFIVALVLWNPCYVLAERNVQLTTTNSNFMSMVAGFSARMQCSLYRCISGSNLAPSIAWFKDDVLLFNGTEFAASSGVEPSNIVLQRTISPESSNVARESCATEEYTLLLKNLTVQDAGEYRCQLINFPQQLDFHLDVLESGLNAGFHSRFTYDYTECCVERGLTPLCRSMCKPRDMHLEFFDPTSCKTDDYKNFLHCATDGGRRNYVPCCRQRNVPSFCYDFCSNNFQMLKRSHRLCLYYLPEIFECFSKQQALYPPQVPTNLRVKSTNGDQNTNKLCWRSGGVVAAASKEKEIKYSIHVKEVSDVMLRGNAGMSSGQSEAVVNNELGVILNNNRRSKRDPVLDVVVAQESGLGKDTNFVKLDPKNIEWGPNSEICAAWTNIIGNGSEPRKPASIRYVAYVQASNEYGTSEPSEPLFVTFSSPLGQQSRHRA